MNILICDLDGVINTFDSSDKRNRNIDLDGDIVDCTYHINALVSNINRFCEEFDMQIVISSSWRLDFNLNTLQLFFRLMGFNRKPIGITTTENFDHTYGERYLYDHRELSRNRSMQIQHYLDNAEHEITNYFILDDLPEVGYKHEGHFYITDPMKGFDDNCYERAKLHYMRLLGNKDA